MVHLLCEGVGIRAIGRLTGLAKDTVLNILETVGAHCARFHGERVKRLACEFVDADELYGFVGCKQANTTADDLENGDQYTFLAMDRNTKLIISYLVGKRNRENASTFMQDLKERVPDKFTLSTDGFAAYLGYKGAVFQTFRRSIDYGTEVKVYGPTTGVQSPTGRASTRFNPVICKRVYRNIQIGEPDPKDINTSRVERLNLSARLFNRRLTRLTLGYSKKLDNLKHSIALLVVFNNWCRVHSTLKKTPAMAQGLTDRVWTLGELLSTVP